MHKYALQINNYSVLWLNTIGSRTAGIHMFTACDFFGPCGNNAQQIRGHKVKGQGHQAD